MSAGRFIFFILHTFFLTRVVMAQCPSADFSFPVDPYQVCLIERLEITNNSAGCSSYLWDFCSGDLANAITSESLLTISDLNKSLGIHVVNDNGNWYAFIPAAAILNCFD